MTESKSLRMMNTALLERTKTAILEAHDEEIKAYLRDEFPANAWRPEVYAQRILATLGLDDIDAAVERMAKALRPSGGPDGLVEADRTQMRTVLEAALTATEAGCVDCGQPMRGDVLKECQNPECGMYAGSKGKGNDHG